MEVVAGYHLPVSLYRDTCVTKGFLGFSSVRFPTSLGRDDLHLAVQFDGREPSPCDHLHTVFYWLSMSKAVNPLAPMIMMLPLVMWAQVVPRNYGKEDPAPLRKQIA